jgi:hypothetical protein
MLTDAQLTAMRAVQAEAMTQTATITRLAQSSDDMGGYTEESSTSTAACRIAPTLNMPDATIYAGRLQEGLPWRVYLPAGTDVREGDRLTVGSKTLEVLGILAPHTYETATCCVCAERE